MECLNFYNHLFQRGNELTFQVFAKSSDRELMQQTSAFLPRDDLKTLKLAEFTKLLAIRKNM